MFLIILFMCLSPQTHYKIPHENASFSVIAKGNEIPFPMFHASLSSGKRIPHMGT